VATPNELRRSFSSWEMSCIKWVHSSGTLRDVREYRIGKSCRPISACHAFRIRNPFKGSRRLRVSLRGRKNPNTVSYSPKRLVPNDLAPPPSVEGSSCARTNPGPRQRALNLPEFRERDWERPGLALVGHGDGECVKQMAWWNECATAVIIAE